MKRLLCSILFCAFFLYGGPAWALTSGQSVGGTLTIIGQETTFTFSGTAGQGIILSSPSSAYIVSIKVKNPDGTVNTTGNSRVAITSLPTTGTYSVVIKAGCACVGSFTLYYVAGGEGVSSGSLTSGTTATGSLPALGLISYNFYATAGQGFSVANSASYTANIRIFAPDGSTFDWSTTRMMETAPSTGNYTIVLYGVNGSDTGNFRFDYMSGAENVSDGYFVTTKPRTGNLLAGSMDSYKFTGISGNTLTISSTGSFIKYLFLYKPDGTYWTWSSNAVSKTLPATGTYNLAVFGNTAAVGGNYTVTVTTPPAPAPMAPTTPSKSVPPICFPSPGTPLVTPGNYSPTPGSDSFRSASSFNNNPMAFVGNPINFDVGYKRQAETDYVADGLSFVRTYRSDSTWTNNTVGALWRHNYARTLNVTASAADITDGSGVTYYYTLTGGNWVPNDPSTTAKLATIVGGYSYTLYDGTVETYNSTKLLTRIAYLAGGALNFAYNGSNQLTSVTNENGRQLTLTYSSGRVATVVTPDGTFSYAYTSGNLTTVTRPDTKTTLYHYENATYVNALTGITDETGVRFATFAYDASGKATSSQHAGTTDNYTVAYTADTSTTTNPLGKSTTYNYVNILGVRRIVQVDGAASASCPASSRNYNYDELGRMIGRTDWQDNVTRYQYDSRNNVTQMIEAAGTTVERITTITYDPTFNLPDLVTEPGKITDYDYDTYGRMTTVTVTDTATSQTRITTYAYYANTTVSGNLVLGRLSQVNGPRTDVSDITGYVYDANFNLTTITNPLSQVTQITTRDAAGRPTTILDANNTTTKLAYNSNGWLSTATQAFGTGLVGVTTFAYDFNGNLKQVTLPNSVDVFYTYDNAQRLTDVTDDMGNKITYTLNAAGDVTKKEIRNATPTLVYTHNQTFDELSRMIRSIGAASQTAQYAYDKNSNLTSYIDPKTNPTTNSYDALERVSTVTDALSGVATSGYNALDDLTSMKNQRNNITTYTYNAFGDVIGETSPDRGTLSYTVDKAGNVTQMTDARAIVSNYTYDALNRLLTVSYPSASTLNATLGYDIATNCGTAYKGRLCTITDAAGTTAFQYDVLGRVTQQKNTRSTYNLTTNYTYDLAGNIATITLPSGRVVTYTRNANGQVSGVSAVVAGSTVNLASSVTYMPFGPLKSMTYGNTRTFTATFDQDYYPLTRAVSSIYSNTYVTDANGNVTQAGTPTYGYDALNRINAENPGTAASYTYDATDNRLTKVSGTTTTTTVPVTSNKISAVGANSYTYDAAGNITADGANTYVWSAAAQLATVNTTGGVYTYNVNNQRSKKVAGGTTTYYIYGAGGLLYGEYSSTGTLVKEYFYLNGEPLAQITTGSPETLIYLHPDHLGTPRYATSTAGASVWTWTADAFGTSTPTGSATVNLRMPGQYFDSESGLFYNWNRYYNPAIGRYISSDPIGLAGGLNTFSYVGQNPVNFSDFLGLKEVPNTTIGPLLPNEYWTGQMRQTKCGRVPPAPPNEWVLANMLEAQRKNNPNWFYNQVRNKGPWDYKQHGQLYEDFGNFNFGATGTAFGLPLDFLERGAGWAQGRAGTSSQSWGNWYDKLAPYGDDPADQAQINSGADFCRCMLE